MRDRLDEKPPRISLRSIRATAHGRNRPNVRASAFIATKTWMVGTSPAMTNTPPPCQAAWRGDSKGGVPSLIMFLIWSRSSGVS